MRVAAFGWVIVAFFFLGGIAFTVAIPQIWIGQIWIGVSLLVAAIYLLMGRAAARQERIRREGRPGSGTILELEQTGTQVNEQPVIRLRLRVEAQGIEPFEDELRSIVPLVALPVLSSGRPLPVHVDPESRDVAIDWRAALAAAAGAPADPATAPAPAPAAPAPGGPESRTRVERLQELLDLKIRGVITPEEHDRERQRILSEL